MRNFKKFLALVLAMLMVSACAVSVSAFDDVKDGDKYAEAIELLADLGVIKGRNDGTNNFYPNDTLTREEAAVMAAKILAGSDSIEWNEATTRFTDVTDQWSFAYINYVDDENVMIGQGGNIFNPKANLRIDEAVKIALAVADPAALRTAEIEYAKAPSLGWSIYYIDAADGIDLTDGITVRNYEAACTRGMFAQLMSNALNCNDGALLEGFDIVTKTGTITAVGSDTVTLSYVENNTTKNVAIALSVFKAALAEAGYAINAADVVDCVITISYSADKGSVYGITLDSSVMSTDYTEGKLANVYDDDDNLTDYIKIAGTKYVVAANDEVDDDTIGAVSTVKNIVVTSIDALGEETVYDASAAAFPTYYSAVAYDDDDDGSYDRLTVREFAIGVVDSIETNDNGDAIYAIKDVEGTVVWDNDEAADDDEIEIVWQGEVAPTDEETPVLYNVDWNAGTSVWNVTVLEVAKTVSGKLTAISAANGYITIDGTKYTYADSYVAPESWTLQQNISIFTIAGEYVNVTDASNSTLYVLVDSAKVADGKAVLSGYNFSSSYTTIDVTVEGYYNGKMYSKSALLADDEDTDFVEGYVYLDVDTDDAIDSGDLAFEDGKIYKLYKTENGYYVDKAYTAKEITDFYSSYTTVSKKNVSVNSSYVYVDDVAKYRTESPIILEIVEDSDGSAYTFASYNRYTAFSKKTVENAYMYDADGDKYYNFIYITEAKGIDTYKYALDDGQTIVQVLSAAAVEDNYDYSVFEAVDLFTGLVVEVKNSDCEIVAGNYYIVADGEVIENTTGIWVRENDITVSFAANSVIGEITAYTTYLTYNADGDLIGSADYDEEAFGVDEIVIYEASNGIIVTDNDTADAADVLDVDDYLATDRDEATDAKVETKAYTSFIVDGIMIIIIG